MGYGSTGILVPKAKEVTFEKRKDLLNIYTQNKKSG